MEEKPQLTIPRVRRSDFIELQTLNTNNMSNEAQSQPLHIADVISTLNDAEIYAQKRVCELVSSIYFYGGFKAETHNERELADLLSKLGYMYKNEDELIAKLHSGK